MSLWLSAICLLVVALILLGVQYLKQLDKMDELRRENNSAKETRHELSRETQRLQNIVVCIRIAGVKEELEKRALHLRELERNVIEFQRAMQEWGHSEQYKAYLREQHEERSAAFRQESRSFYCFVNDLRRAVPSLKLSQPDSWKDYLPVAVPAKVVVNV